MIAPPSTTVIIEPIEDETGRGRSTRITARVSAGQPETNDSASPEPIRHVREKSHRSESVATVVTPVERDPSPDARDPSSSSSKKSKE